MSRKDPFRPQTLGEFLRAELATGRDDVWNVLIGEGLHSRTYGTSHHSEVRSHGRQGQHGERSSTHDAEDPFASRWSARDRAHQRAERDHPQELDFER